MAKPLATNFCHITPLEPALSPTHTRVSVLLRLCALGTRQRLLYVAEAPARVPSIALRTAVNTHVRPEYRTPRSG